MVATYFCLVTLPTPSKKKTLQEEKTSIFSYLLSLLCWASRFPNWSEEECWKTTCLVHDRAGTTDNVRRIARQRGDEAADLLLTRMAGSIDLEAVQAHYHDDCRKKFIKVWRFSTVAAPVLSWVRQQLTFVVVSPLLGKIYFRGTISLMDILDRE